MRSVAVVGVGQTKFARRTDVSFPELIYEAVKKALQDAGISIRDVDAVVSGSMPPGEEGVNDPHLYWSDSLGALGKPHIRLATCGTTGMSVAQSAFYHVASGLFNVVLAVGAEKMLEGDPQGVMSTVLEPFFCRHFISGAPSDFAMQVNQYASTYNLPEDRVREAAARIAVDRHENALDNPHAHLRQRITVDDVMNSRIIAYPVRLLDICLNSDGACAVIFASEEKARKMSQRPAWVKGLAYCGDEYWLGDSDKVNWEVSITAAKKAYAMAGIQNPRKEIDVAELYNPFTFQELIWYETFGFCDPGEGCSLVEEGVVLRGGELPVCPSGGVLCANPIGASGIVRVAEAALQVMSKAGDRQIDGAKTAFCHAMGGTVNFVGTMILSNES